jgi:hypothetical protein
MVPAILKDGQICPTPLCLPIYLFNLSIYLSVCPSIHPSIHLFMYLCLSICPSISVYLPTYPTTHCLLNYLRTQSLTNPPSYLPTYVPTYPPTHLLPTYLSAVSVFIYHLSWRVCLYVYISIYLDNQQYSCLILARSVYPSTHKSIHPSA